MSRERAVWLVAGGGVLLCLGWAVIPQSPLYTAILTPHLLLSLASVMKMTFLASATVWCFSVARHFEAANPIRSAWRTLGVGLGVTFLGQFALAPYQIGTGLTPFPSIADVFFVAAYPFLMSAMVLFIGAYRAVGFPVGSVGERVAIVTGVAGAAVLVGIALLPPLLQADVRPLEKALNVGYPLLDFVLLMPLAVLLRATVRFAGSQVGRVWQALLGGFVLLCVGDIVFAYFSSLGQTHLDPYLHATFILAYASIAVGVGRQVRILAD